MVACSSVLGRRLVELDECRNRRGEVRLRKAFLKQGLALVWISSSIASAGRKRSGCFGSEFLNRVAEHSPTSRGNQGRSTGESANRAQPLASSCFALRERGHDGSRRVGD